MRHDVLELDGPLGPSLVDVPLDLGDVEAIRMLLSAGSVIDWHKAAFGSLADVDRLLHLLLIDPDDPEDQARLRYLFTEAIGYVEGFLQLRIPAELRDVDDVRQVFLWASNAEGFRRTQVLSCTVLKLMHVMHHLESADLRHRSAISEQKLLDMAHRRIDKAAHALRASGRPLVAFHGSRKTRLAVVTKLLSKRDDVAATIVDKLRYRVVVPTPDDLPGTLQWLIRNLLPFHHALPGESHNNLLDPEVLVETLPPEQAEQVQRFGGEGPDDSKTNEFSGASYRMINLVAAIPVRLPADVLPPQSRTSLGRTVFVTAEFQLVDAVTAKANEEGENAHHVYKARQYDRVRRRLLRGAAVPDEER